MISTSKVVHPSWYTLLGWLCLERVCQPVEVMYNLERAASIALHVQDTIHMYILRGLTIRPGNLLHWDNEKSRPISRVHVLCVEWTRASLTTRAHCQARQGVYPCATRLVFTGDHITCLVFLPSGLDIQLARSNKLPNMFETGVYL